MLYDPYNVLHDPRNVLRDPYNVCCTILKARYHIYLFSLFTRQKVQVALATLCLIENDNGEYILEVDALLFIYSVIRAIFFSPCITRIAEDLNELFLCQIV